MRQIMNKIIPIIEDEKMKIIAEHGYFNSPHEALAVLREEVEEVEEVYEMLQGNMELAWSKGVRKDDKLAVQAYLEHASNAALLVAAEAVQCSAVIQKYLVKNDKDKGNCAIQDEQMDKSIDMELLINLIRRNNVGGKNE